MWSKPDMSNSGALRKMRMSCIDIEEMRDPDDPECHIGCPDTCPYRQSLLSFRKAPPRALTLEKIAIEAEKKAKKHAKYAVFAAWVACVCAFLQFVIAILRLALLQGWIG